MRNTILKALTYRIIVIITQLIILYVLTGNIKFSLGYSILIGIITTIEYITLENLWKKK